MCIVIVYVWIHTIPAQNVIVKVGHDVSTPFPVAIRGTLEHRESTFAPRSSCCPCPSLRLLTGFTETLTFQPHWDGKNGVCTRFISPLLSIWLVWRQNDLGHTPHDMSNMVQVVPPRFLKLMNDMFHIVSLWSPDFM